jgi:hypothetical protein
MARFAKLTIVCGRRGSGKSNKTLSQIYKAVTNGRKAMIFDYNNEYGDYLFREDAPRHSIKAIYYRDVPRFTAQFKAELVRLRPILDNGEVMGTKDFQEHLAFVLKNYSNGILLVEDVTAYIAANTPMDIMGKLSTLRQRGVDLIMQYQHVGKAANPQIIGQANYIRLHKTNDSVVNYADGFADKTDMLSIAESIVNKRYDNGVDNGIKDETGIFFSVVVDLDSSKIRGVFTKQEAEEAITNFISTNAGRTINRLTKAKDRNGKVIYENYGQAYHHLEKKYLQDYFVFK